MIFAGGATFAYKRRQTKLFKVRTGPASGTLAVAGCCGHKDGAQLLIYSTIASSLPCTHHLLDMNPSVSSPPFPPTSQWMYFASWPTLGSAVLWAVMPTPQQMEKVGGRVASAVGRPVAMLSACGPAVAPLQHLLQPPLGWAGAGLRDAAVPSSWRQVSLPCSFCQHIRYPIPLPDSLHPQELRQSGFDQAQIDASRAATQAQLDQLKAAAEAGRRKEQ